MLTDNGSWFWKRKEIIFTLKITCFVTWFNCDFRLKVKFNCYRLTCGFLGSILKRILKMAKPCFAPFAPSRLSEPSFSTNLSSMWTICISNGNLLKRTRWLIKIHVCLYCQVILNEVQILCDISSYCIPSMVCSDPLSVTPGSPQWNSAFHR